MGPWKYLASVTVVLGVLTLVGASKCPKCPPGHEPRSCWPRLAWSAQCAPCAHQTWSRHWSRGFCRPCTPCPPGFYTAEPCTKIRDTLCFPCETKNCEEIRKRRKMAASSKPIKGNKTGSKGQRHARTGGARLRFRTETEVGPPYKDTFQGVQALAQKGGHNVGPGTKPMTNVGVYVGIGIGIAALVVLAVIIWCCVKYRQTCCTRPPEDDMDDPSKPTYVAMTPITPGEKDHLVFPTTMSSSPHHHNVVMVSIPNGDCSDVRPLGQGPIDIPCLVLFPGLLDDGEDIKFIDETSSDEESPYLPHVDTSDTLDKDNLIQSAYLTEPTRYIDASSPSLSTRPLLKSDCEQSTDTLDSSLIHSTDSILDRTPVDDLDNEVGFVMGRRKRPRSPDPFAVEEDEPLLDRARSQKVQEANGVHNHHNGHSGVPSNWWDTQSTSSSEGSEPHENPDHDHREMIPIIIGGHHHQCPNTEHSLTELERQFDAMISDWEQFQQGNKDSACPYYIYEDQCLETIPESPEFDYQESETSRCSSISALYPWRKPPYSRHPPPPTDSEDSDSSDEAPMQFEGEVRFSPDFPRFSSDPNLDDGGPGLLMHSPLMEDLTCIGTMGGRQLGSSSSSTSSLDHVLEINAGGHDNHAVILTSSDEEEAPHNRVLSDSSIVLEQKLSVVRPSSFIDDDRPSRPRSLVEDRPRYNVDDRPHSMVEFDTAMNYDYDDLPKIPVRTRNNNSSSSTSSSTSTSEDSSLIKESEQTTPVMFENKMFQD